MQACARRLAIEPGMDAGDAQTACCELGCLVLHERDERTDDQRRAAARYGRQLVAERFAGAGRHDQQQIAPGDGGAADLLLIRAEGRETEDAGEQIAEAASFRRGNVSKERWPGRLGHGVDPSSHSARGGEAASETRPRLAGVDGCSVGLAGVRLEVRGVLKLGATRVGFRNAATQPRAEDGLQGQQTDDQCEGKAECRREEIAHARTPPNGERPLFLPATERTVKVHQFRDLLARVPFLIEALLQMSRGLLWRRRKKSESFR